MESKARFFFRGSYKETNQYKAMAAKGISVFHVAQVERCI